MYEPVRSAITGFVSGVAGALIVLAFAGLGSSNDHPVRPVIDESAGFNDRPSSHEQRAASDAETDDFELESDTRKAAVSPVATPVTTAPTSEQRLETLRRERQQDIETNLRVAGWSEAEIDDLDQAQERAQLESANQRYEAMQLMISESPALVKMLQSSRGGLRTSLGDEKYEQYLEATGRSAVVRVHRVLAGSTGESAGLQAGDRIRRYGAERVFDDQDLMMAILHGKPGETVTVEIERDGVVFYVSVPRGPLGTANEVPFTAY